MADILSGLAIGPGSGTALGVGRAQKDANGAATGVGAAAGAGIAATPGNLFVDELVNPLVDELGNFFVDAAASVGPARVVTTEAVAFAISEANFIYHVVRVMPDGQVYAMSTPPSFAFHTALGYDAPAFATDIDNDVAVFRLLKGDASVHRIADQII